ncbi:MAG TPA: hypothetical protein VG964_01260 [Candidatus Saccharimonadales bacterium]|nr:hypothetical protein [Candidatus Saccharimonadales bacterium]
MISALKSEIYKLLTVRTTYIWSAVGILFISFFSYWVWGYKYDGTLSSLTLAGTITQVASVVSLFGAIVALLLMTHEYRHNTIVYTLTASNGRLKVLVAKIMAVMTYTFVFSFIATLLALVLIRLGISASSQTLPAQDINYIVYLAKSVFESLGYALAALLFAALIRNQVGSLAVLFIVPNTVEGLLSLLLKHNSVYLPFTALQQVIQAPTLPGSRGELSALGYIAPLKAAVLFAVYLTAGWLVCSYLFVRRDAS